MQNKRCNNMARER
nr:unnamed protein product [Callosobruchus analis]